MPASIAEPPHLPSAESDLDAWRAYAEALRSAGDPRGSLMLLDLSLPSLVEREPLRLFHAAGNRLCRQRHAIKLTWCLAHIHTLEIWPTETMLRSVSPEHGAMANARDLVLAPHGQRLTWLATTWPSVADARAWRRLVSVLPPTCRRVALLLPWRLKQAMAPAELIASLPSTVRELGLMEEVPSSAALVGAIIDDRFETVDLGGARRGADLTETITSALARTHSVKVRLTAADLTLLASDRIVLGHAGNAALVDRERGRIAALRGWPVSSLQRRYGILPVRAQLERLLPELHGVAPFGHLVVSHLDSDLARRGDAWTVRGAFQTTTAVGDRVLAPGEVVAVRAGDQLRFGETRCELVPRVEEARRRFT